MSAIALDDDLDRDTADPGIIPGGIRDRAMRAVQTKARPASRGHRTRASKKYWAALKRQRETEREPIPCYGEAVTVRGWRGP
jgi:hypothetical protein